MPPVCTFLWISLLGIHPIALPDEDLVLQAAIAEKELQIELRVINKPPLSVAKDLAGINNIHGLEFQACQCISQDLGLPINVGYIIM